MMFKKLELETSPASLFEAVEDFYNAEETLPATPSIWEDESDFSRENCGHLGDHSHTRSRRDLLSRISGENRTDHLLDSCQRIADRISATLGWFNPSDVVGKHGPGAVSKLPDTKYKYHFARWSQQLEALFPLDVFARANLSMVEDAEAEYPVTFEAEASRLCSVPKTALGPRLIAAEPLSNQWIQQGVARYLCRRVKRSLLGQVISFDDQTLSGDFALEASATGRHATVDLKSASDKLSCYAVQRLFRANISLLGMMKACRTIFMTSDLDPRKPNLLRLKKFATMGSALTFPIQSVVFAMISLGVGSFRNPHLSLRSLCKDVRVFGDDIIVPVDWVDDLTAVLTALRLEVSTTKTFATGNFREACGVDAFRGVNVTPARISSLKRLALTPSETMALIDTANNFHMKGMWRVSEFLIRTVPQIQNVPVVDVLGGASGLFTFNFNKGGRYDGQSDTTNRLTCRPSEGDHTRKYPRYAYVLSGQGTSKVRLRVNYDLQRYEVLVSTPFAKEKPGTLWPDGPSRMLEYLSSSFTRPAADFPSDGSEDVLGGVFSALRGKGDRIRHLESKRSIGGRLSSRPSRLERDGRRWVNQRRWESLSQFITAAG